MKKTIILVGAICLVAFLVRAFTEQALRPDPPKRSLPEAYSSAVQALGSDTNQFYCVAAKVDHNLYPVGAWVFTFDQTAFFHRLVYVAMEPFNPNGGYDKPWPLTKVWAVEDITHTTNSVPEK